MLIFTMFHFIKEKLNLMLFLRTKDKHLDTEYAYFIDIDITKLIAGIRNKTVFVY